MSRRLKKILLITLIPLLGFGLYIAAVLAYGTANDFRPPPHVTVPNTGTGNRDTLPDTLSLFTWNIGYAGLGREMDFFYDGGSKVEPERKDFDRYITGICETVKEAADSYDVVLLQEVDTASDRSYQQNEFMQILQGLSGWSAFFGLNYEAPFVPTPIFHPLGKCTGGLATYARFHADTSSRFTLPGAFGWPKRVFILDRCVMVTRFPLSNGKQLIVMNTHNSAYDDDGKMKKGEMEFIRNLLTAEYELGNYVIAGGDWNATPPFWKPQPGMPAPNVQSMEADIFPPEWLWAFDPLVFTNRSLEAPFDLHKTRTQLIDYFLLSPNLRLLSVQGYDLGFENSDHNPVGVRVALLQQ